MRTATLALLGAVIAVQAHAMPELAGSARGSGPIVTVQRGVAWFYGHRFKSPFTLEYSDDGLAINGYSLPREVRTLPKHSPTHGDTMISELSVRTLEILRDARRSHVPRERAVARVEQAYRSSPVVKTVELRGYFVLLTYTDRPGSYMVSLEDPETIAPHDMTSEELDEKQRGIQWKTLRELKSHFESVGLVVWFDQPAYTLLSNDPSLRVDVLLQRMQRNARITNKERAFLRATIPMDFEDLRRLIQRPSRLVAVSSNSEG